MSLGIRVHTAAVICIAAACLAASTVPGRADSSTDPLAPASGALLGAFANGVGGQTNAAALAQIESTDGRPLTVVNRYAPWRQTSFNVELGDFAAGRIPMISWSPGGTTTAAAIADGSQDAVIENAAEIMKSFGHPFFLRLAYEMDQPPGSPRYIGAPGDFIAAWQRVYDIFQQVGATNARFVWCAIGANFANGTAQSFYPGSRYVDWIAADAYNWYPAKSKWATYAGGLFNPFYSWASQQGKPLMIAETGSMEDPADAGRKAAWITDAASWVESHPDIKAWVYFSSVSPKGYSFQLSTSAGAEAAFAQVATTPYFEAQPGGASQDPPPPTPPPAPPLGLRGVLVTPSVFAPGHRLLWVEFRTSIRATDEIQVRTAWWKVVRTKLLGTLSAAGHATYWRGQTDAGRMLPPGHYWVRFCASSGDQRAVGRWHEVTLR